MSAGGGSLSVDDIRSRDIGSVSTSATSSESSDGPTRCTETCSGFGASGSFCAALVRRLEGMGFSRFGLGSDDGRAGLVEEGGLRGDAAVSSGSAAGWGVSRPTFLLLWAGVADD